MLAFVVATGACTESTLDLGYAPTPSPTSAAPAHLTTSTAKATATAAISSPVTVASSGAWVLASVVMRGDTDVSDVSGLSASWAPLEKACGGRDQTRLDVWIASDVPAGAGTVTVLLTGTAITTVLAVSVYQGVSATRSAAANTNGIDGACAGGVDSNAYSVPFAVAPGSAVFAAIDSRNESHTIGDGLVVRGSLQTGNNGDDVGVTHADSLDGTPPTAINGSLGGTTDWAVVAVELVRPGM